MSRIRRALRRNYDRYLWLAMRRDERQLVRERASLRLYHRERTGLVASQGRIIVALMRNADQCFSFLGLDRGAP